MLHLQFKLSTTLSELYSQKQKVFSMHWNIIFKKELKRADLLTILLSLVEFCRTNNDGRVGPPLSPSAGLSLSAPIASIHTWT